MMAAWQDRRLINATGASLAARTGLSESAHAGDSNAAIGSPAVALELAQAARLTRFVATIPPAANYEDPAMGLMPNTAAFRMQGIEVVEHYPCQPGRVYHRRRANATTAHGERRAAGRHGVTRSWRTGCDGVSAPGTAYTPQAISIAAQTYVAVVTLPKRDVFPNLGVFTDLATVLLGEQEAHHDGIKSILIRSSRHARLHKLAVERRQRRRIGAGSGLQAATKAYELQPDGVGMADCLNLTMQSGLSGVTPERSQLR